MNSQKIYILGAGGHSKVLIDCLNANGNSVAGLIDNDREKIGQRVLGVSIVGNDEYLTNLKKDEVLLVNGIGSTENVNLRKSIFLKFKKLGFSFFNVIHPNSTVSMEASLEEGSQVLAGSIVGPSVKIKENVIINNGAIIEHDSIIGEHCHISPGSVICGSVKIGDSCHVGARTVVIQNIEIGDHSLIGAGSVVVRNLKINSKVKGVPAI